MTGIATGVFKQLAVKRQTGLGVISPPGPAGSARLARRTTSTLDLTKSTYQSAEILVSQQRRDMRHGVRSVTGSINGELSVGGYQPQFESVLRQLVQPVDTTGALTTVSLAVVSALLGTATLTRAAGSFITDGFNVGDVITMAGWASPALNNNGHYALVTAISATVLTLQALDGNTFVAKAAGDSVTTSLVGKKTFIPQSAQTRDYYTIEHWFSDLGNSEVFTDCVFTGSTITLPATGMATVAFPVMGLNMTPGVAQYFTSPALPPTGPVLASVGGVILVGGVPAGIVTAASITINGTYTSPDGVVGSNVKPDIFPGPIDVTGSLTVLFNGTTLRDAFLNETESSVMIVLTGSSVPAPAFTSFIMNRIKFAGATKNDGTGGLEGTYPFTALENYNGGAGTGYDPTTIAIQDSAFA